MSGRSPIVDAIVVGSGPNGLAAAIELAREGHSVQVLEAADTVGGGARSDERTLPGFVHDACSAIYPFGRIAPFFAGGWLERRGVRWIEPPIALGHPLDDGTAVVLQRDVETMAASLGRDADEYRDLFGPLVMHFDELLPDVLAPFHIPVWPPARTARLAWFGILALQPASWLAGRFVEERTRALLAGAAAHSLLPLRAPVSGAAALVMLGSAHRDGWPFPAGGAGTIPAAMTEELLSLRGSIETSHPVEHLEELPAHGVTLFDLTPRQIAPIAGSRLPAPFRRGLERYRYGPGIFKLDLALDGPVPWRAEVLHDAGTIHLGGTFEEIEASERAVARGQIPVHPFVLLAQPSRFDPSRAPAGKDTLWAYCHVPNGSDADMTAAILGQIERFAPGFRRRILKTVATGPAALEAYNANDVGGDIAGGWNGLRQLFTRPSRRFWDPYSTPNPSIFVCSASTPPGGGVHGMCGFHAARSAARRLR
ncbi:MAG TPA: NAD(P)/FAD-dependent oxidoreductase [Candidatus Limnocylindrales bacterium]|nr:NAD(P)/FAD-dependent oxidoreductase [Candidatus Limnocylindrales bacterium]